MITEQTLRDHPAFVKALLGILPEQLWELVEHMHDATISATQPTAERTEPAQQRVGRPYAHPLPLRVAALLTYLRLHIPQTLVGLLFGLGQEDVSRDLRRLLPMIQSSLPCPEVWSPDPSLAEAPLPQLMLAPQGTPRVLIDATEQRIQRPQDALIQSTFYSGKSHAHTLKTQVVSDDAHHILAISEAVPGALHDKALADQVQTVARLPDDCEGIADKGYQGLDKTVPMQTIHDPVNGATAAVPRVRILTPVKKPLRGSLSDGDAAFNQALSRVRIRVEHCLGWMKNWAILATRFRCSHTIYTAIMGTICGFVNVQTARWQAAKAKEQAAPNCA